MTPQTALTFLAQIATDHLATLSPAARAATQSQAQIALNVLGLLVPATETAASDEFLGATQKVQSEPPPPAGESVVRQVSASADGTNGEGTHRVVKSPPKVTQPRKGAKTRKR